MFILPSCSKFDDSSIWDKLNEHGNRIAELEILCRQMNTNISSMQTILEARKEVDIPPRFTTH